MTQWLWVIAGPAICFVIYLYICLSLWLDARRGTYKCR